MTFNSKSLIQKVKKVKFEKLNSTILQSHIFMSIRVVLENLGKPLLVNWSVECRYKHRWTLLAEPTRRLRVCSLQHLFSLQSFDWSSLWHHRAWLRLDMLNPEWFYSLYDVTVAFGRHKTLLENIVLAKPNFKQSRSRPIHKALATHIWVATHGFRNADLQRQAWDRFSHLKTMFQTTGRACFIMAKRT